MTSTSSINNVGGHLSHCCARHGCKYGHTGCPVVHGQPQEHPCEYCSWDQDDAGEVSYVVAVPGATGTIRIVGYPHPTWQAALAERDHQRNHDLPTANVYALTPVTFAVDGPKSPRPLGAVSTQKDTL